MPCFTCRKTVLLVSALAAYAASGTAAAKPDRKPGSEEGTVLLQMVKRADDLADRSPPGDVPPVGGAGDQKVTVQVGDGAKLPNSVSYYAVNTIEVQEAHDNPCFVRLWGNMVEPHYAKDQDKRILAVYQLGKCSNWTQHIDDKQAGFQPAQHRFIRGLRICRHEHGSKHPEYELKGVGVLGGELPPGTDRVTPLGVEDQHEFKRPNCPDRKAEQAVGHDGPPNVFQAFGIGSSSLAGWTDWSTCPADSLLTGVDVYIHGGKYFSGMTPICTPVHTSPGPAPVKDGQGY
jgi:hypothetical protein